MSSRVLLAFDLDTRRALARADANEGQAPFASLADVLARELEPLVNAELPLPEKKARLTRHGGRCPEHGVFLEFDPWSPHDHWCVRCNKAYQSPLHDDWWAMGAQLWTAERAVHAAALFVLRGDARHAELAARILRSYADQYYAWPNADNVLGPSRPFFSTYLESIWLLNLCHALALLEGRFDGWTAHDGNALRAMLIEPSAALIASYNEGRSNRQVWNEVAISSAWCLLDREDDARKRLDREFGIRWHIANGLDDTGSWYEGENYHLFAHRGLWYGVQLMRALGEPLAPALDARYSAGFLAPFAGLLPDDTFPSRNDSQYASSIRQWRTTEWCELGWAHTHDQRIAGILTRLYDGSAPHRDTGRARSTADAERNTPASALTRADLSWRALLMADAEPAPSVETALSASQCLPAQGLAVIRRDRGRTYVALEGGQLGGGHGHPDQLSLTLQTGDARWLDDPGTGSYVDADLAWYRSTMAHAAPQFDHRSQEPVAATLIAFEDAGDFGWMVKRVNGIAEGVQAERAIVVGDGYLIDVLEWHSEGVRTLELPIAGNADMKRVPKGWILGYDSLPDDPEGVSPEPHPERVGDMVELRAHPAFADPQPDHVAVRAQSSGHEIGGSASVWYAVDPPADGDNPDTLMMRALVPAAPWRGITNRHWIMANRAGGRIVGVWSWPTDAYPEGAVADVRLTPGAMPCVHVTTHDGVTAAHSGSDKGWRIDLEDHGANFSRSLAGFRDEASDKPERAVPPIGPSAVYVLTRPDSDTDLPEPGAAIPGAIVIELGEPHYVRTEQSWSEAGAPTATVQIIATGKWLVVDVQARTGPVTTNVPDEQGRLDNEHMDVNADGLQWYIAREDSEPKPSREWHSAMLHVPRDPAAPGSGIRSTEIMESALKPAVESATTADGWAMRLRWSLNKLPLDVNSALNFELVVNERPRGRERRRGQLVLSGGGGFGYLAGWSRPSNRFVRLVLPWDRTETTFR